ncbi:MAG: hypothetical protein ACI4J6_11340 [Oscillospiraceae bacterium]
MVKPKTKDENILSTCSLDYSLLVEKNNRFSFFKSMLKDTTVSVSRNITDNITEEQLDIYLKNIYDNTDFKKYEKQKYYLEHYFLAIYLNIIKDEILKEKIAGNKKYLDFLSKSREIKITWFDKLKIMLTTDTFFDYLKDKYYYFESDKIISEKYYKGRLKFYRCIEKILFYNEYRAFAVMQDYFYNAERIAKYHFKLRTVHHKKNSKYSIVIKLIIVTFFANLIVQVIIHLR